MAAPRHEGDPAAALVAALVGRTVVDATCDGEGVDDVRLMLDDGTAILLDAELDTDPESTALAKQLGRALAALAHAHRLPGALATRPVLSPRTGAPDSRIA